MKLFLRSLYAAAALLLIFAAAATVAGIGAYYYVLPSLPAVESLQDVRLQVPLRVYTRDGRLMAEYGEMRRIPLAFDEIPPVVVDAFLAAEDDRFFEHPGVDYQGLVRATASLLLTGERRQGGGTITMQVARNFFLTREKTISRKVREIFLALRIESQMGKKEIITLYMNAIFLGQRAYGVGAAAEVYFGKTVDKLSLGETATIAGLPKAPSRDNPVSSPERALQRRAYVLRRMLETGSIDRARFEQATAEPMESTLHGATVETDAPYAGEMVRQHMLDLVGPEAYTAGYVVITSIDSRLQAAAVSALRQGLMEYDRRHGYRGPLARIEPDASDEAAGPGELMSGYRAGPGMELGIVTSVEEQTAEALVPGLGTVVVPWEGLSWAREFIDDNTRGPEPATAADILTPGDLVELSPLEDGNWRLSQVPLVQGAIVAVDPIDGAVAALSGGFDFQDSKYNRAAQARRQPGSAFKPFIYSAALENGFTTATIVNDAPVVFDDDQLESTWRPENYSQRFYGPTRLREALVRSRNLVSIRVLRSIGVGNAVDHIQEFGISGSEMPKDLSLALGSVTLTPLELADAYTVFANGGFSVDTYLIDRIMDAQGNIITQADPLIACAACEDAEQRGANERRFQIDEDEEMPPIPYAPPAINRQNAYLVADMMRDVIRRGTGRRALALGRGDLAGKTGTTNDRRDAWFSGFNGDLVATAWVGFDQERPLGAREEGGRTALPIWVKFMGRALAGAPERPPIKPPGLVTVRISSSTGLLAGSGDVDAIFETFRADEVPPAGEDDAASPFGPAEDEAPIF
ncbi:MAG: penicillin-binding protein 1A [Gammaproteobacteria bacterium]|jgi:penicillin-binding protein 1A